MCKFATSVLSLVLLLFASNLNAQTDVLIWNGEGDELIEFIKSKNENNQVFALQKIIMNPEKVNANYVAYDIYKLYRYHKNDKVRQMALVALYRTKYYWLLKNLEKDLYKEKNPNIRNQIMVILENMPVLEKLN